MASLEFIPFLARTLVVLIFVWSGLNKILNYSNTLKLMSSTGIPLTAFMLNGEIAVELAGGMLVILGYETHLAAIALLLFLISTTLIFHTNFADSTQVIHFLKNFR